MVSIKDIYGLPWRDLILKLLEERTEDQVATILEASQAAVSDWKSGRRPLNNAKRQERYRKKLEASLYPTEASIKKTFADSLWEDLERRWIEADDEKRSMIEGALKMLWRDRSSEILRELQKRGSRRLQKCTPGVHKKVA